MVYRLKLKPRQMKHGSRQFDEQYFGFFFKQYDQDDLQFYYRWFLGWIRFLDRLLPLKDGSGKSAYEVGCGIGAFAKILHDRGFRVKAGDISNFIIEKAAQNLPEITFKVEDIEKKVKTSGRFDYIFAFEVVEHLHHPQKALTNLQKKLKKNGAIIFSTPYPTTETLADPMHINVHTPDYWLEIGRKLGFKSVSYHPASFLPFGYRYHHSLSRAIPIRTNLPYVNSTGFFIFSNR